jgi:anti-anti-sigma regulatory factor
MSGQTPVVAVRQVEPELTIYQVRDLRSAWLQAYAEGARDFDLSAVTEIDGAGAQLMASLAAYGEREADPVLFTSASAVVQELLELLGATALLARAPEGASHDA